MQRNSKTNRVIYAEMSLQNVVAVIDSSPSVALLEKRKKDAEKPLYLKRV